MGLGNPLTSTAGGAPTGVAAVTAAPDASWCTVRVHGPRGALDVSLPAAETVAATTDELVSRLLPGAPLGDGPAAGTGWCLHRVGQGPLPPDLRLAEAGVRDGETLHVSPRPAPEPARVVDDGFSALASGASVVARWSASSVGVLLVVLQVLAAALVSLLATALPGGPVVPVVLALGLTTLAGVRAARTGARRPGDDLPAAGAALAALPAWLSAGLALARVLAAPTPVTLTVVGAALVVGSGLAWLVVGSRVSWWAFVGATGLSLAVVSCLVAADLLSPGRATAVVMTAWLALLVAMPWLMTRARRWSDPGEASAPALAGRARQTRHVVDAVAAAGGLTLATGSALLGPRGDGLTLGFVAAVAVTVLLRARRSTFVPESAAALGAGALGLAAVAVGLVAGGGVGVRAVVLAVAVLALAGLAGLAVAVRDGQDDDDGLAAWWARPRTVRTLGRVEAVAAVTVLPLLAGVLGVYTAAADIGTGL